NPKADTPRTVRTAPTLSKKERKRLELESMRSLRIDTSLNTAFMEVNTFTKGNSLRSFFRKSFKEIKKKKIPNLVVDVRGNGGGSVVLSNLLTKYIADKPFTIADSLYALRRTSEYGKYRNGRFFNWLFLQFLTRKRKDGTYHFGLYEGKKFSPKSTNHFDGTTYIVTGGNTFSAATLFAKTLKDQDDVIVVGEETGGGAYGNSAWLIPDVTLPNTGVRFRLPLFRLVIDKNEQKGFGVQPEVSALPTVNAIRRSDDYKMVMVKELILSKEIICTNAKVTWAGNPQADGLGWVLQTDRVKGSVITDNLPESFKAEGLLVKVCIQKTTARFSCECSPEPFVYHITSIEKITD
ncbi:MAG: hypothetical protein EOO14_22355, partial [Chitinophagaceae bacterium]